MCFIAINRYGYAMEFMDFGPYKGKVVDAETKEPIEEAVAMVYWNKRHFFAGSTVIDYQETLTDKNGDFSLPGIWVLNPWKRLTSDAILTIYKSGYHSISTGIWKDWDEFTPETDVDVLKLEDGKPVIILKKMTTEERKQSSISDPTRGDIPREKKKLLLQEIDKDYGFKYPPGK